MTVWSRSVIVDAWLPPYPFDMYYAFQQYAAALLGRIFSLSPGLTYNVAFCVLISLAITAAAVFAYRTTRSALATTLLARLLTRRPLHKLVVEAIVEHVEVKKQAYVQVAETVRSFLEAHRL